MEVKGIALKTTRDFVKTNFPGDYSQWLNALPESTRKNFEGVLDVGKWYPLHENYLIPLGKISGMFFNGNEKKCGEALGYYSADVALKGIYKVFLLMASPNYLMQRASKIITTYYQPSQVEAEKVSQKSALIRITEFSEMDAALEYRFAGWCKRALELSNCSDVSYTMRKSLARREDATEILFEWS